MIAEYQYQLWIYVGPKWFFEGWFCSASEAAAQMSRGNVLDDVKAWKVVKVEVVEEKR